MACALELPGSGPQPFDEVSARDPIIETPGAPAESTPPSAAPASAPAPSGAPPAAVNSPSAPPASAPAPTSDPDAGSDRDDASAPEPPDAIDAGVFTLSSSAFDDGARLPSAFTCRGADDSPPLSWTHAPADTKSFALVLTSKSARAGSSLKVEWVLWGIPAMRSSLPQGVDEGRQPSNVASAQQHSPESDTSGGFTAGGFTAGAFGGAGAGPWVGATNGGAWPGAAGGVPGVPVGVPGDGEAEPRYRGPCGSSAEQLEFTLFALASGAPRGGSMDVEAVEEWLDTREHVLASASLSATFP